MLVREVRALSEALVSIYQELRYSMHTEWIRMLKNFEIKINSAQNLIVIH